MKFTRALLFVPLLLIPLVSQKAFALFKPWDLYDAELKALFVTDGCVHIRHAFAPPSGVPPHVIRVDVCEPEEARALATLVRRSTNAEAQVVVFGPDGNEIAPPPLPNSPHEWTELFDRGLGNDCFYIRSFPGRVLGRDVAFAEIANTTFQFFIDNPGDPNGNVTSMPAIALFDILTPSNGYQLFTSEDYVSACGGKAK